MTKSDPNHNEFECPNCDEWIQVPLPSAKYVDCPWCKKTLEIMVDAEWFDGMWHDRTELSIVDDETAHKLRMLEHAMKFQHP